MKDFQEAQALKNFIKNTAKVTVSEMSPFSFFNAKVVSVSGNYATVRLFGDTTDIADVINKTHETLSVGNRVVLMAKNGNLGDCIIHTRWENNIT